MVGSGGLMSHSQLFHLMGKTLRNIVLTGVAALTIGCTQQYSEYNITNRDIYGVLVTYKDTNTIQSSHFCRLVLEFEDGVTHEFYDYGGDGKIEKFYIKDLRNDDKIFITYFLNSDNPKVQEVMAQAQEVFTTYLGKIHDLKTSSLDRYEN